MAPLVCTSVGSFQRICWNWSNNHSLSGWARCTALISVALVTTPGVTVTPRNTFLLKTTMYKAECPLWALEMGETKGWGKGSKKPQDVVCVRTKCTSVPQWIYLLYIANHGFKSKTREKRTLNRLALNLPLFILSENHCCNTSWAQAFLLPLPICSFLSLWPGHYFACHLSALWSILISFCKLILSVLKAGDAVYHFSWIVQNLEHHAKHVTTALKQC